jgi:hypothetical protein
MLHEDIFPSRFSLAALSCVTEQEERIPSPLKEKSVTENSTAQFSKETSFPQNQRIVDSDFVIDSGTNSRIFPFFLKT